MSNQSWALEYYDADTQTAYRIATKRLKVRDGIAMRTLEDDIARREELTGRDLLERLNYYPLMHCGTREVWVAQMDEAPPQHDTLTWELSDDADWRALDVTEDVFLDLDEFLMMAWVSAVLEANPHHDRSYEALKKNARRVTQRPPNEQPMNGNSVIESAPESS